MVASDSISEKCSSCNDSYIIKKTLIYMLCGGNEIFCGLFIHRTSMLQKVIVPSLFPDVNTIPL